MEEEISLAYQAVLSRSKTVNSKAMVKAIEANAVSCFRRVSGEFTIS